MGVIPRLPALYDEPFADSSQIPTFLVSQLARRHVTVSLSGDAGDELFAGYNRYFWTRQLWNRIRLVPRPLRLAMAAVLSSAAPATWDRLFAGLLQRLPSKWRHIRPGDKLHKIAATLATQGPEAIYWELVSFWPRPTELVPGSQEPPTVLNEPATWPTLKGFEEQMMYLDQATYLTDDILVKVDRAAMGVSLESRIPLLDHRVVEFAWRLPLDLKIRAERGKWLLRQVLYRYVPRELVERPKMGFGVPIDVWLRGPLRDWAEALLDEGRLRQEGFLSPGPIRDKWQEHLSGCHNWSYYLWSLLMFQAWLEAQSGT
jgi:asparagine synthase (glutamine-hydrolysing)